MALLSKNDVQVLKALLDVESSLNTTPTIQFSSQSSSTASLPGFSYSTISHLQAIESAAILPLNEATPSKASIEAAILELSAIIASSPDYPSAYNNRAQALRILVGSDLTSPTVSESTLYSDLCAACELAIPESSVNVSPLQGKLLALAHTQRGHLLLMASKAVREMPSLSSCLPPELSGMDWQALERLAGRDFTIGGRYGNTIAKQLAVGLNPYAKMCGDIVKEAIQGDLKKSRELTIKN